MKDGVFFIKELKFKKDRVAFESLSIFEQNAEITLKNAKTKLLKSVSEKMGKLYEFVCKLFYQCETQKEFLDRQDKYEKIDMIGEDLFLHKLSILKNEEVSCVFVSPTAIQYFVCTGAEIKTEPVKIQQWAFDNNGNEIEYHPISMFYKALVELDDELQNCYPNIFEVEEQGSLF